MAEVTKFVEEEVFITYTIKSASGEMSEYAIPSTWSAEDIDATLASQLKSIDPEETEETEEPAKIEE